MFLLTWGHLEVHGLAGRAQWVVARCKGLEKPQGEKVQGGPQQEEGRAEAHERPGDLVVPVEPGGLE